MRRTLHQMLALIFAANTVRAEVLKRVLFDAATAAAYPAVCLDGSPAGYYVNEKPDSKGWVIYLEGGGLCITPIDCKGRTKGGEGSSTFWSETFSDTTNVLAGTDDLNPFGSWSHVWVPYCSGDTWTGTTIKNDYLAGLATTGHNIVTAVVDHLHNTTSFPRATQLLLSGGSAGGIGVFHNIDYVGERLGQLGMSSTVVKGSPQAGFFFPTGVCNFETFALGSRAPFDGLASWAVHLVELGYVNPACVAAEKEKWRCWDVSVVSKYLRTPMFLAQNAVDSNQAHDELLCPPGVCGPHPKLNIARAWMADYANKSHASMLAYLATHPTSAVFMPGCFDHTGDLCMGLGPQIGGVSYRTALSEWYFEGKHRGALFVDGCDASDPVCNPSCGKGGCGDAIKSAAPVEEQQAV